MLCICLLDNKLYKMHGTYIKITALLFNFFNFSECTNNLFTEDHELLSRGLALHQR